MAEKLFSYADKQVMEEVGSGGGGGGSTEPLLVHENESFTLDATWQEIYNAVSAGRQVVIFAHDEDDPSYGVYSQIMSVVYLYNLAGSDVTNGYVVEAGGKQWVATTQNGYPAQPGV